MFNTIHQLFRRPESGWDPVSAEYARSYAALAWRDVDPALIDFISARMGLLEGKRVLDLGAGPGQYSVTLAKRGADVVWHDASHNYLEIARQHASKAGVSLKFSIGHLESARRFLPTPFDLVFCRVCWCYCARDREFARLVYSLVRPGGLGYIETDTFDSPHASWIRRAQSGLNAIGFKVGHPQPPRGLVPKLIQKLSPKQLEVDGSQNRERIIFVRG